MVLMIDDEDYFIGPFVAELELRNVEVQSVGDIRTALEIVSDKARASTIEMIVLDIMMDSDDAVLPGVDTENGTLTGFFFLEKLLPLIGHDRVVVLTNVRLDDQWKGRMFARFGNKIDCFGKETSVIQFADELKRRGVRMRDLGESMS